jgi:enoyl-CoA hydratase/carnithine racemase
VADGDEICRSSRRADPAIFHHFGQTWWLFLPLLRVAGYVPEPRGCTLQLGALMPYQHLLRSTEGQLGIITLNRPDRRNALSFDLMRELIDCLAEFGAEASIRAIILAAAGKVFSSGHDLSEMTGRTINDYRRIFDVCTELMTKIQSVPQPVIAQVQGIATAAGCQLVATCDLAIASDQAQFATPGVKIGLFCTTPMVALSRAIGRKRAMEMLLTGKLVDAATAAEWGLVNRVVAADQLEGETRRLACQIAQASGFTVALGKQAFYAQIDLDQPKAYAYAKEVMSMNSLAHDAQEGISAFLEKRAACWTGK